MGYQFFFFYQFFVLFCFNFLLNLEFQTHSVDLHKFCRALTWYGHEYQMLMVIFVCFPGLLGLCRTLLSFQKPSIVTRIHTWIQKRNAGFGNLQKKWCSPWLSFAQITEMGNSIRERRGQRGHWLHGGSSQGWEHGNKNEVWLFWKRCGGRKGL